MDVMDKIKNLMKNKSMSRYQLAKSSDIRQSTISNLFNRGNQPTLPILQAIVEKGFGMTMSQFFCNDEEFHYCTPDEIVVLEYFSDLSLEQKELIKNILHEFQNGNNKKI